MDIYRQWGFTSNPFQTTALPANRLGRELLLGRNDEVTRLLRRLRNPPMMATVEGANGIGKTSLINVASYIAFQDYLEGVEDQLLIPCTERFQLSATSTPAEFEAEVYRKVAHTLIARRAELELTSYPDVKYIDMWLNHPQLSTFQATLGPVGLGRSSETNTSEGFSRSGFKETVRGWLRDIFPTDDAGGVVCIVDNLEILQTSQAAKHLVEELRDTAFSIHGIRWVLCGSLGIVKSVASSPRIEGFLYDPIEVSGFSEEVAKDVFLARKSAYSAGQNEPYLPLLPEDFERLYEVLNRNVRNSLAYTNRYCMWVADNGSPDTYDEKRTAFQMWLDLETSKTLSAVKSQLKGTAWQLFEAAAGLGGAFSPSDYEIFGFNSISTLRPHVKDLEDTGLLTSSQDETDQRRKLIQITPKGWAVLYARQQDRLRNPPLLSSDPIDAEAQASPLPPLPQGATSGE